MNVIARDSPNQSQRVHGDAAVRLVVLHTPEGPYRNMVSFLTNPKSEVSYHLLISEDGSEATQLVPYSRKAWHAKALNSLSDGISLAGFARDFDIDSGGVKAMARVVAARCVARSLQPQWTTDVVKGGFCRHGDLQADRSDPTPDMAEWRVFVGMVQNEYAKLTSVAAGSWPVPLPPWTWAWMRWHLGGRKGKRPKDAPRLIPPWAWRRLRALRDARR